MSGFCCLLVDDHVLLRDGLALLIRQQQPSIDLHMASRLDEALVKLRALPSIDLVLLDLSLPDVQGIDTLVTMRQAAPDTRVIVISADDRPETVSLAIEAGAASYIPKSADWATLQQALSAVLSGRVSVPETFLQSQPISRAAIAAPELALSPRQMDVLRLLIDGKSNKVIGRHLDLAPSTVNTHIRGIFDRLGVNNRTQAVVHAARMGIHLGQD